MKKAETIIVQAIIKYIKNKGGDAFHVHGSGVQRSGEPDIDGSMPDGDGWIHLKVEVKTPSGTPSAIQLYRIEEYKKRGYCAGIVTDIISFAELVQEFKSCRA